MADAISISAIIISVTTAIATLVKDAHIQKCKACCIDSDCRQSKGSISLPRTPPIMEEPKLT